MQGYELHKVDAFTQAPDTHRYTYTNPDPRTIVRSDDRLFVLASVPQDAKPADADKTQDR